MLEEPTLKHLCLLIEIDLRTYQLPLTAEIYYDRLCNLNEIVTQQDMLIVNSFLVGSTAWITERGKYVRDELCKKLAKLGFYSSILNKNKRR